MRYGMGVILTTNWNRDDERIEGYDVCAAEIGVNNFLDAKEEIVDATIHSIEVQLQDTSVTKREQQE